MINQNAVEDAACIGFGQEVYARKPQTSHGLGGRGTRRLNESHSQLFENAT